MNAITPAIATGPQRLALCDAVAGLVPAMAARAGDLDEREAFPADDIAALRNAGVLIAPFPENAGGLGMGSEPAGGYAICDTLRLIGRGNLAVGRLIEAHVNAVRLLARYGTGEQIARAWRDAADGYLFGLWVTDTHENPLRAGPDGTLLGSKGFCSAAGHVGRALVTVYTPEGTSRLAYLSTKTARVIKLQGRPQGMRATATGGMSFDFCRIEPEDWVGGTDDYMREPDFSAGAWRTSAVTCGGLEALVDLAMRQLFARGRAKNPHQLARIGQMWIAQETALSWLTRAASAAERATTQGAGEAVATVHFARIAIETACLDAMRLVERSLGLAAFLQPDPIERVRRDLATYLRQPAGDEVLTEAAAHVLRTRLESL